MSVTRGSHGETPLCICLPSHLCLAWGPLAYWEQNIQIGREKKKTVGNIVLPQHDQQNNKKPSITAFPAKKKVFYARLIFFL